MLHCYEAFVIISQQDISVVWKAEGQETPVELMFVCLALSHGPSALAIRSNISFINWSLKSSVTSDFSAMCKLNIAAAIHCGRLIFQNSIQTNLLLVQPICLYKYVCNKLCCEKLYCLAYSCIQSHL